MRKGYRTLCILAVAVTMLAIVVVWAGLGCSSGLEGKLRGRWRFTSVGEEITFDEQSKFTVEWQSGGPTNRGTYSTDFSKAPAWIDFALEQTSLFAGTAMTRKPLGIIRFLDDDTIEIAFQGGGGASQLSLQRPTSFESANHVVTLRRIGK